jgi:UPF0755 protein
MREYSDEKVSRRRWPKALLAIAVLAVIFAVGSVFIARRVYTDNLRAVNATAKTKVVAAIPSGTSVDGIAKILKAKNVIRAEWAFKRYVTDKDYTNQLKAGTYRFNTTQNVSSIVSDLVEGKVDVQLFTIFPAQRLDQIRKEFIDKGFSVDSVDKAFNPKNYAGFPALVDKPEAATLEGYLYPDSFQRVAETTPETVIAASITEMAKVLTPEIRSGMAAQGLSVYQGIILASIVEQEIPSAPLAPKLDRRQAAQVFLKRIKINMQLGSDVTAYYGAIINGRTKSVTYDSPYNTRLHSGFPPSPIGNVTGDGLDAVAFPATSDYLYFVAGDDHITYFSKTLEEHQAAIAAHCKVLCTGE